MIFLKHEKREMKSMVDLMGKKWWFFILSLLIIIPGIFSLSLYGLKLGVDFTGGALLEYKFEKSLDKEEIRSIVSEKGVEVSAVLDSGENNYIIKTKRVEVIQSVFIE